MALGGEQSDLLTSVEDRHEISCTWTTLAKRTLAFGFFELPPPFEMLDAYCTVESSGCVLSAASMASSSTFCWCFLELRISQRLMKTVVVAEVAEEEAISSGRDCFETALYIISN